MYMGNDSAGASGGRGELRIEDGEEERDDGYAK
eukprot:COSAG02_NODE_21151_length_800_cov_0.825963_1_plen_32_part_10